jgi:hypothetical protein
MSEHTTVALPSGHLFADRFTIERLLGRGGMGAVYLSRDLMLDDEVIALKILHRDLCKDERHAKRFLREVQLARRVGHPNVVRTFEVGQYEGQLYFTMEYAAGPNLKDRAPGGIFQPFDLIPLLAQICDGLAAIHELQIIHRDLKPGNIIVTAGDIVKITDFGVARPPRSDLTGHNEVVGSLPYMSPEMWKGVELKPVADLYSLGIMAYELLTGKVPFEDENAAEIMRLHLYETPPRLTEVMPHIPKFLDDWVFSLLEKDPKNRPQSAQEAGDILISLYSPKTDIREKIKLGAQKNRESEPVILQIEDGGSQKSAKQELLISKVLNRPEFRLLGAMTLKVGAHLALMIGLMFVAFMIGGAAKDVLINTPHRAPLTFQNVQYAVMPLLAMALICSAPLLSVSWLRNPGLWGIGPFVYYFFTLLCLGALLATGHTMTLMASGWFKGTFVFEQLALVACAAFRNLFEIAVLNPVGSFYKVSQTKLELIKPADPGFMLSQTYIYYCGFALHILALMRILKRWVARASLWSSLADPLAMLCLGLGGSLPVLAERYNLIVMDKWPLKISFGPMLVESSWFCVIGAAIGWGSFLAIQFIAASKEERRRH